MANRLAAESSPYLLQHADNPVDWRPWGPEALSVARDEEKPIFVSIGYAACHWCHVMAHESFEDPAVASLLNRHFVPIKVDREERPDLDAVYMEAVQALTGQGGWPLNVFLTPGGEPFFGGTYFPPLPRYGMPSFTQVLQSVAAAWRSDRERLLRGAEVVTEALRGAGRPQAQPARKDDGGLLRDAVVRLVASADAGNGGWGDAPKFPQPMVLDFLLRSCVATAEADVLRVVRAALDAMLRGGIYDQLGGGFHRYATDAAWLVPHFEKMLYDNAQLARVYLHAWQVCGDERYRRVATETLEYVLREMTDPGGGFYASQDADSEGREGAFFVWTPQEVRAAFATRGGDGEAQDTGGAQDTGEANKGAGGTDEGSAGAHNGSGNDDADRDDAELLLALYGIAEAVDFEGRTILSLVTTPQELAAERGLDPGDVARRLDVGRARLFAARERRVRPARDEKVLAAWNGLMLETFAEAARALGRDDFRRAAERNAAFILDRMRTPEGHLRRSYKDGRAGVGGFLDDYADVAKGLLQLYQTTFDERWFVAARELADHALVRFAAPDGGFFDTSDDHEELLLRPRSEQDNALPSGGAALATVLLELAAFTGEGRYHDAAVAAIAPLRSLLPAAPTGFAQWLIALDLAASPVDEVALVAGDGIEDEDGEEGALAPFLAVLRSTFRPHLVVAAGRAGLPSRVPLLREREPHEGAVTAYVCRALACRRPVTDPAGLARELASS